MGSSAVDQQMFRDTLAGWPSGVAIVTTVDAARRPWGFTASSFVSLSMEPPLVMVCLDRRAECRRAFDATSWFAVHILGSDQAELASRFATRGADKFASENVAQGMCGLPILPGTLGRIECGVIDRITGGDHVVMIGEVRRAVPSDGEALIYYRRDFHRPERVADAPLSERRPA